MTENYPMEPSPKETLYIRNLNDKINKYEVKRLLYHLFSSYGYILNISVSRSPKMRGQAFIVFDNISSADKAKLELQNFNFLDKPLVIDFSREKSDVILREGKDYENKPKFEREKKRKAEKRAKIQEKLEKVSKEVDIIPSKELRVTNLHPELIKEDIKELFGQYIGLVDVKLDNAEARVLYESEEAASMALAGLNGFKVTQDYPLIISYVFP